MCDSIETEFERLGYQSPLKNIKDSDLEAYIDYLDTYVASERLSEDLKKVTIFEKTFIKFLNTRTADPSLNYLRVIWPDYVSEIVFYKNNFRTTKRPLVEGCILVYPDGTEMIFKNYSNSFGYKLIRVLGLEALSNFKDHRRLKVFYEKDPLFYMIRQLKNNDRIIIGHSWAFFTHRIVDIDDIMYYPNEMKFIKRI
jgi:hypothetical protein